ncbi:MAG: DUF493 family protein [Betaproteobacteria bacterium]|nr:DUF493 family protein [Betaproteobacteria bacterium]
MNDKIAPAERAERASLLQFPTAFPVKVMGARHDDFAQAMLAIVMKHAPDFDAATLEMRPSKNGNYLSVTATVNATSQQQLDDLYRELTAHPMVKVAL